MESSWDEPISSQKNMYIQHVNSPSGPIYYASPFTMQDNEKYKKLMMKKQRR